eukprot:6438_1
MAKLLYIMCTVSCIHSILSQKIYSMKIQCEPSTQFKSSFSTLTYPQCNVFEVPNTNNNDAAISWSELNNGIFSTKTQLNTLTDSGSTLISNQGDILIKVLKYNIHEDLIYIYGDTQSKVYYSISSKDGTQKLSNTALTSSTVVLPRYQSKVASLSKTKFVIVWKPSQLNNFGSEWKYKIIDTENPTNSLGELNLITQPMFNDYVHDNGAICTDRRHEDKEIFTFIWREYSDIYLSIVNAIDGSVIVDAYKLSVSVSNLRGFFVCVRRNALHGYHPLIYEYVLCMNSENYHSSKSGYDILCMTVVYDGTAANNHHVIQESGLTLLSQLDSRHTWAGDQTLKQQVDMIGVTKYFLLCFVSEINGINFLSTDGSIVCSIVNAYDLSDIMVDSHYIAAGDSTYGYDSPSVEMYDDTHFTITYSYFNNWGTKLFINRCRFETIYYIPE